MQTKENQAVPKHASAQQAYHRRQLEKGFVRVNLYVPEVAKDEFWAMIDGLRASWQRRNLLD